MQIKVNKLQKTIDSDVYGATAVVIFLDKGNIVYEERFSAKVKKDMPITRSIKWEGVYDKHQAVLLDGAEFEYELILDEDKELGALASLLNKSSEEYKQGKHVSSDELKTSLKKRGVKKDVQ